MSTPEAQFKASLEKAKKGNQIAQFNVGVKYANGQGISKDDKQASEWYRKAAEQGHADAQSNLGVMYRQRYWRSQG